MGNSVGITLDKEEAQFDGILDLLDQGEDVHTMVSRRDTGEWLVKVPEVDSGDDEQDIAQPRR